MSPKQSSARLVKTLANTQLFSTATHTLPQSPSSPNSPKPKLSMITSALTRPERLPAADFSSKHLPATTTTQRSSSSTPTSKKYPSTTSQHPSEAPPLPAASLKPQPNAVAEQQLRPQDNKTRTPRTMVLNVSRPGLRARLPRAMTTTMEKLPLRSGDVKARSESATRATARRTALRDRRRGRARSSGARTSRDDREMIE